MVTITHFKFIANTNKSVIKILTSNGRADTLPNPWEFFLELGHLIYELYTVFFLNKIFLTSFVIAFQFQNPLEEESLIFCRYSPNTKSAPVFCFRHCFPC